MATPDLAMLCQTILQELTDQDSPGASMDFYFYQDMYDLQLLKDFLRNNMDFNYRTATNSATSQLSPRVGSSGYIH